jgi:peptidoglycan/LPS O-acetylase OafA/YrhL
MGTQKKNKIEIIDFIKGYSILTIVIYHFFQNIDAAPLLSKAINFGGSGIHTFLFASGFGLYLSQLRRPLLYTDFLIQRGIKIYIPYILIVTLSAMISLFIPIYENTWNNYFSHIFLYKMFDDHLTGSYGYQLWFVSTIIQFYLFFPVIVKLRKIMPANAFLVTGLLISISWSVIILLIHKEYGRNWNGFFLTYMWEFMLGMYCGEAYLKREYAFWNIRKATLAGIFFTGIALYAIMALKGGSYGRILNDVPAFFGYASLSVFIYLLNIKWVNRFLLYTAKISFSIFLIHFLVINLLRSYCSFIGINWAWYMLFPVLVLCYLVSLPLQNFFDYIIGVLLARRRAAPSSMSTPG